MSVTTDELLERASERTNGLTDLGPAGWEEGFEHLVAAIPIDLGDDVGRHVPVAAVLLDCLGVGQKVFQVEHGNGLGERLVCQGA